MFSPKGVEHLWSLNTIKGEGTNFYLGRRELMFSPRGLNICGRLIPPKEKE